MMLERLTTGQRGEVRTRLTQMEAEVAVLFLRAETLTIHLEAELVRPVMRKLAETVEALRQLKVCVQRSGERDDEPEGGSGVHELRHLRGGDSVG